MRKLFLLSILTLTFLSNLFSTNYEVTGQVKDSETKENLSFCYVHVYTESDSLITTCVTDQNGYFKFDLPAGEYKFLIKYIGYMPIETELMTINENKFIDVFKLEIDVNLLNEISVSENSKIEYFDKDVQIVTEELKTGAANTYDVLDKVQGLHYDRYNNKISVDNDPNIIIIVNGIEKDADYIKNLNPDRILKVEIVRSPAGKFALDGYSAVLNIILKSDYKGTDLSFSNMTITNPFENFTKEMMVNFGNVSFNYTNRKLNIYSGINYNQTNIKINNIRTQNYNDGSTIVYKGEDYRNLIAKMQGTGFTIGADYFISPKHSISYEFSSNYSPEKYNSADINYIVTSKIDTIENSFFMKNIDKNSNYSFNNSIFYVGNFNDQNSLNINYTYSVFEGFQNSGIIVEEQKTFQETNNSRQFSTLNLEYNHSFSSKTGIILGYGNIYKNFENEFVTKLNDIESDIEKFAYTDARNQLYSYLTYKPIKKISIKFGVAAENSLISHDDLNKSFIIWQPHFDLSYKPVDMVDVTLKYRSQSNYPQIGEINPFSSTVDVNMISKGNPNLKPSKSNTISFRINAAEGAFFVEPYYRFSNNSIINIIDLQENNIWLSTYENAGKYEEKGIKGNLTIPFAQWLILQSSIDFSKEEFSYNNETTNLQDWTMNSQLIYIGKKYSTIAGLLYQNEVRKNLTWQGYYMTNNDFWALLIQQPLFKERLNLMLIYVLPVNFGVCYNQGNYTKTSLYEEYNDVNLDILKNAVMFNITYRFSKGNDIKKIEKNIDIEEEIDNKGFF